MDNLNLCGVAENDSNEIVEVYYTIYEDGTKELFYNNDPYGIVSIFGLKDAEVRPINKEVARDRFEYLYAALASKARGGAVAIIYLEDGLLFVKETMPFSAVKQPFKFGEKPEEEYTGYADVTDLDDDSEEYAELIEIM